MKLTIEQAIDAIMRGETSEQYKARLLRIRRLVNEREALEDAIGVLGDDPRANKKRARLVKVNAELAALQ